MPSYNVVSYIEECIESVISQTLEDIEIICVDAGSQDGTFEILEKYAEEDNRIKLLKSDEKSYGYQMNLGLSVAKGEYIGIVETDDYIDKNMFFDLYDLSENASIDIVKGNFYHLIGINPEEKEIRVDGSKVKVPKKKFTVFQNANIMYGHPSIWAAIYKNEFLKKNNIKFMEVPGGGWVDNPFYFETFLNAKSIKYTKKPYYYYRQSNPNSSSNNLSDLTLPFRRMLDNMDVVEKNNCKNEDIYVALYTIIFWHINDIVSRDEYLKDKDNVDQYIQKVISRMDGSIVAKRFDKKNQDLFLRFLNQDNEEIKISIIMPVYNSEDELEQSIKSVDKQTLKEIELICIDDGSTDNSLNILRDFEKRYDFVKVYTQENQGSGKARNYGIELSKGEYIGFLDADDLFNPKLLEKLYNKAKDNDADISMCCANEINYWKGETTSFNDRYAEFDENTVIDPNNIDNLYVLAKSVLWNKMFKKEFIEEKKLYFTNTHITNDLLFVYSALTCSKRITVIKEVLVTRRKYHNENSISSNRCIYSEESIYVFETFQKWLKDNGYWKRRKKDFIEKFKGDVSYHASYGYNKKFV